VLAPTHVGGYLLAWRPAETRRLARGARSLGPVGPADLVDRGGSVRWLTPAATWRSLAPFPKRRESAGWETRATRGIGTG